MPTYAVMDFSSFTVNAGTDKGADKATTSSLYTVTDLRQSEVEVVVPYPYIDTVFVLEPSKLYSIAHSYITSIGNLLECLVVLAGKNPSEIIHVRTKLG